MYRFTLVLILILGAGCSWPPQPPVVDGTARQHINHANAIEEKSDVKSVDIVSQTLQSKSQIFSIHFPFNSTKIQLNTDESTSLCLWLTKAHYIKIRGRTDAQNPSPADEKIALNRALTVKRYLIEQGVSPIIISINYLSAGDYIADNTSKKGRIQNRRVDIEIFTH